MIFRITVTVGEVTPNEAIFDKTITNEGETTYNLPLLLQGIGLAVAKAKNPRLFKAPPRCPKCAIKIVRPTTGQCPRCEGNLVSDPPLKVRVV